MMGVALIMFIFVIIEQVSFTKNISKGKYTYVLIRTLFSQPMTIKLSCISDGNPKVSAEKPEVTIFCNNILLNC